MSQIVGRALQSEAARGASGGGGGGGGISPRILSQPSSPCFSATSPTSSACTSPGRAGRAGSGRHGGGGGFSHAHGGGGPSGFAGDGAMRVDGGGALHTTLSLRLSGDGGRVVDADNGVWGSSSSGFATAPPGGNIALGFGSNSSGGSGGGGGGGRGVIGGGSRSNGASPSLHAMSAPKSLPGSRSASRLGGAAYYDDLTGGGNGASHGASLRRPGSAGPTGRASSRFAGDGILSSNSVHGMSSGSMAGGIRAGVTRKSSYDDRRAATSWLDGPQSASGGDDSRVGMSNGAAAAAAAAARPTDLRINHASQFDQPFGGDGGGGGFGPSSDGVRDASTWGATRGGSGGGATEDMTAMMCAEFALLTPKRALEQQQQQRQQSSGLSSPLDMWSSAGWAGQSGGSEVSGNGSGRAVVTRVGSANSSSAGSGGVAMGSRGGSEVSSPEGPRGSRASGSAGVGGGGGRGGGDDADENSASSGGSGGGGRQGSVRPAFGATLDSAAGAGGGGGGEASIGGGAGAFDTR